MPFNHLILCCPHLPLPSIFPSIRVFSNESILSIIWANNWSFNFNISFSSEYSGLIILGWTGLISLQSKGLLSLLQHHSSKGIYVCHLSVMSYSPCWDLTTKTEFKQCAKISVKTQCTIYSHSVTRRGSSCIQGTVINRSHAGIGPGNPGWVFKYDCLYFGCQLFCLLWLGRHFKIVFFFFFFSFFLSFFFFFLYVWFGRQNFSQHRPYEEIISEIHPFIFSS